MKYALLIYGEESKEPAMGTPEQEAIFAGYMAFSEEAGAAGKIVAGEPLEATSTSTCVQVVDGQTITTDGPYAETKEQLGGFYILDCADLDEALAWATKIPHASIGFGRIEVRPVPDYGQA